MRKNWGDNACLRSYLPSKQRIIKPIMGTVYDNYRHIILLFMKCCWLHSIRQGCLLYYNIHYINSIHFATVNEGEHNSV